MAVKNQNYGRPLPKEQFRRTGVFFGTTTGNTDDMKPYFFSYKNQGGVDFSPNTFEWVHFTCIANDDGINLYGATMMTADSLRYDHEVEEELRRNMNMTDFNFEEHSSK